MSQVALERDNVFRDGWEDQLGTMIGTIESGLTVSRSVPV